MFTPTSAAVKLRFAMRFVPAFLGVAFIVAPGFAKDAPPAVVQAPAPGAAFHGMVDAADLDANAFAEWADGKESVISGTNQDGAPQWVLWTKTTVPGHSGIRFGASATPGVHHLRIGFTHQISVGTVMVNGGGVLSVLKPNISYPGDLGNETQWLPAQRLMSDGQVTSAPVGSGEYACWVLPAGTSTRALRFTHASRATDTKYQGTLGTALVTDERFVNEGAFASVATRSGNQNAGKLNNGLHDGWGTWENREIKKPDANEPVISADNAEWILLTWPAPVKLTGLALLWTGFSSAEVQTFAGPAGRHPRDAMDGDWRSLGTYEKLQHGYPKPLWPNRIDFGREIVTRAVRVRVIASSPEVPNGHHLFGKMMDGRRIWLGELMALRSLGNSPLQAVKVPEAAKAIALRPPVPVKFTLKRPGYVTLVIEKPDGVRVRNLVSETWFPAGENTAWWDGTDDLGRDIDAARHGIYRIPARFVEPGEYRVRGLVRGEVKPYYEFSVYTTGNPPWDTADHTGAWLANHSAPSAAAFVPASQSPTGEPAVYLGCYVTEGPDGLAWVDLDGRKRGGKKWIGGNWTAAPYLARDAGPSAVSGVRVYVASVWETEKRSGESELRVTALTDGADKAVLVKRLGELAVRMDAVSAGQTASAQIGGLAAHNAVIAVSLTALNQIVLVNAADGAVLGQVELPSPRGLAFDAGGRLLALSGDRLLRFDSIKDPSKAGPGTPVVGSGLDEPVALALDGSGRIYVSVRGATHQVRIFTPDGRPAGTIGKPGVPKAGPYDPLRMQNPAGITIDSKDRLWVTECDYLPKRVSVWTLDGRLADAFYGPGKYGGGGTLDSTDKTRFYYADEGHGAMEFKLDWAKGSYELTDVFYRPGPDDMKLAFRSAAPESAIYHKGRRYFTNVYNSSPVSGHNTAFLFIERDGVARPAAAMGRANEWDVLKADAFRPLWPAGVDLASGKPQQAPVFFIWNDLNGDAQAQPDEVFLSKGDAGGVSIMNDLAFCLARLDGKTTRFAPVAIDEKGNPRYDFSKAEVLASGVQGPASSGGNQALVTADGWTAVTLGMAPFSKFSMSGAKDGVAKWSYPNLWPGLHASHESPPPDHPGELVGPTRLLGGLMNSKIGPLWAVNSNQGCFYVFTADGLFVATVFEDTRLGKRWNMPRAVRGMSLEGLTLNDENFWPTISQLPDGTVYLVDGGRSSLVRIDGLNDLARLPDAALTLTREDLDRSRAYLIGIEAARQQAQGSGVLTVVGRRAAPVVDGKLDDWPATGWVDIDQRGVRAYFNSTTKPYDVTATVAVAAGRLYAAWRTGDAKLLDNSGEMPIAPFKTGGALDLMIGANPNAAPDRIAPVHGDVRLLVTVVGGKPRALLYRPVVPNAGNVPKVPFSSPWRTINFDRVDDVTAQLQFGAAAGNYEISVPLDALQLRPAAGMVIKGDIGILRGEGGQTIARVYWANKATGITADVPSEAMLTPNLWGNWLFAPEEGTPGR